MPAAKQPETKVVVSTQMKKGYLQVYTGNGKGKTTAALGLAIRAAGAGLKVFFAQFIKKRKCSEHTALQRFSDQIIVKQYGTGFIRRPIDKQAFTAAQNGFAEVSDALLSGEYDVVILDEINIALHNNLIDLNALLDVLSKKPRKTEVVLTGRNAPDRLIQEADLVTEMNMVKHYLNAGVKARKGIEQ